jgi:hypothetical protein
MLTRTVPLLFAVFAIANCGDACSAGGCGSTWTHKAEPYHGRTGATEPYLQEATEMTRRPFSDNSVIVTIRPWLHNPTDRTVYGRISCIYDQNDWQMPRKLDPVKLEPRSSRKITISQQIDNPLNDTITQLSEPDVLQDRQEEGHPDGRRHPGRRDA